MRAQALGRTLRRSCWVILVIAISFAAKVNFADSQELTGEAQVDAAATAGCPDPEWGPYLCGIPRPANSEIKSPSFNPGAGLKPAVGKNRERTVLVAANDRFPYRLDQPETRYLLAEDIVVAGRAFELTASSVTLDLGGHTITYSDSLDGEGVFSGWSWLSDVEILNGSIQQGAGGAAGSVWGFGNNPILVRGLVSLRIANIQATYYGRDMAGFFIGGRSDSDFLIEHSRLIDQCENYDCITNRHQAIDAIRINTAGTSTVRYNLIESARQRGIRVDGNKTINRRLASEPYPHRIHNNDVRVDNFATNSFGIEAQYAEIYDNRVINEGAHSIGLWLASSGFAHGNYVQVSNTRFSTEYGETNAAAWRTTWGGISARLSGNTFLCLARQGSLDDGGNGHCRTVWAGLEPGDEVEVTENLIVSRVLKSAGEPLSQDVGSTGVSVTAHAKGADGLHFENNVIAAENLVVSLADRYGSSEGLVQFVGDTFYKIGSAPFFQTIGVREYHSSSTDVRGAFFATIPLNGAQTDTINLAWERPSNRQVYFGSQSKLCLVDVHQQPVPNMQIAVRDCKGLTVFEGRTDEAGCERVGFSDRDFHNLASGGGSRQIDTCGWSSIQMQQQGRRVSKRVEIPWPESLVFELSVRPPAGVPASFRPDFDGVRRIVR